MISHISRKADGELVGTSARMTELADMVSQRGSTGMTVVEVRRRPGWDHHGHTSGMLSDLQRAGVLTRLKERREGCQIYIDPVYVDGREEAPQRKRKTKAEWEADVEAAYSAGVALGEMSGYLQGYHAGYKDADNGKDMAVA